jgi:8-oxo-dGTP diphosphatase
MRTATICFLLRGTPPSDVLLGYKKRGFGAGKIVGVGGKVESGESIRVAARREVAEECGLAVAEPQLRAMGQITFRFSAKPAWNQVVHIFVATEWTGDPVESAELRPTWYPIRALPFDQMWDDSRHWLPRILAGEPTYARITFAPDNETVRDVHLEG